MEEEEAQPEQERHKATQESVHGEGLGSRKGSSARVSAETGPQSVGKGPGPLRQDLLLFGAGYSKKTGPREPGVR
jgi:hypothetical protein